MASSAIRPNQRPTNWKAAAPNLPSTVTFAAQSNLPKLPVPKLTDTLGRLKESLKPIAWSEAEFEAVANKIDAFEKGKGAELHDRLLKHNEKSHHWLEQWWDDAGYQGYRDSVRPPRLRCPIPTQYGLFHRLSSMSLIIVCTFVFFVLTYT
jgi:carnitine O-acetyltransferase